MFFGVSNGGKSNHFSPPWGGVLLARGGGDLSSVPWEQQTPRMERWRQVLHLRLWNKFRNLPVPENDERWFEIAFFAIKGLHFQVAAITFWECKLIIIDVTFCYFQMPPKGLWSLEMLYMHRWICLVNLDDP